MGSLSIYPEVCKSNSSMQHCNMERIPLPLRSGLYPPRDCGAGPSGPQTQQFCEFSERGTQQFRPRFFRGASQWYFPLKSCTNSYVTEISSDLSLCMNLWLACGMQGGSRHQSWMDSWDSTLLVLVSDGGEYHHWGSQSPLWGSRGGTVSTLYLKKCVDLRYN